MVTPPRVVKILIWLARAFVSEASERKTRLIFIGRAAKVEPVYEKRCLHHNKPTARYSSVASPTNVTI